jgi:hypothetical protein
MDELTWGWGQLIIIIEPKPVKGIVTWRIMALIQLGYVFVL